MIQSLNRILVIRRDNIGDLICTTPLLSQLRETYPSAQVDVLVNSYNYDVIALNPDVNNVYVYTKVKHREHNQSLWSVIWQRFQLIRELRSQHYDAIILAGGFSKHAEKLAKQIRSPMIIGMPPVETKSSIINHPTHVPLALHEVEQTSCLLIALGIEPRPQCLTLYYDPILYDQYKQRLTKQSWYSSRPVIGLHISARKVDQRWPAEYFVELVQQLYTQHNYQFLLFWSPGDETNKHHPGDDQKAQAIINALSSQIPLLAYTTKKLRELIAAMNLCDAFICSDGGAMHIAAGLGKPIVCFFGSSDAQRWHPWGVPHRVIQSDSRQVIDINPIQVRDALEFLNIKG
ncbi:MAG: glycosyltransferase family 9 protein [Thiofilum sp.]|uniref:glycosyltransferase family 9 protein n=1 Tax=Thiofilum sp. TaxID=2212733 RepID=UPI0025FAFD99|nr:glycosyltransferase family 9 protein [Thiofilum sp.]MBK8451885.1 glycosyltransferase family 9 protein [Thiofilum sp.]